MNLLKSEKGNTLIIAILVLVMGSVIGLTLMSMSMNGTKRNEHRENYSQAVEQAEKGIKHINLEIQEKLKVAISELEKEELAKSMNNKYLTTDEYLSRFNKSFDEILTPYICKPDSTEKNLIDVSENNLSYTACLDANPYYSTYNTNPDHTLRELSFTSTGTADGETKILKTKIKLGAKHSDYPSGLNYAVETHHKEVSIKNNKYIFEKPGNLILSGGVEIHGDVHADGNIAITNKGNKSKILSDEWVPSVNPMITGNTSFPTPHPSPSKIYYNPEGHLFKANPNALENGCKGTLLNLGLITLKTTEKISFQHLSEYKYNLQKKENCLFEMKQAQEIVNGENLLSVSENKKPDILESLPAAPINVDSIVKQGKDSLANTIGIANKSKYTLYSHYDKIGGLGSHNLSAILDSNYNTKDPNNRTLGPKWLNGLTSTTSFPGKERTIIGDYRITADTAITSTKYKFDGNFFFDGNNLNLLGYSSENELKGNYYFKNGSIKETSIWVTNGKDNVLDGNFYLEKGLQGNAMCVYGPTKSLTLKGTFFLDGSLKFNDCHKSELADLLNLNDLSAPGTINLKTDAIFFVKGDVVISNTVIEGIDGGKLMIFATGDITIKGAIDDNSFKSEDFNGEQKTLDTFLYSSNGKIELHGTLSNYKFNGGIAAHTVLLSGIRGKVEKSGLKYTFPSANEQGKLNSNTKEYPPSRLIINYDETIADKFNAIIKDFNSINNNSPDIVFNDLDFQPAITLSRELK